MSKYFFKNYGMKKKESFFTLNPLKIIVWFINIFINSQEEKDNSPKSKTSALTQERAKIVDEKAEKVWYSSIIRIITTWNSKSLSKIRTYKYYFNF